MLEELTSSQISEWQAYDKLEPIGREWRADYRIAQLCSLLYNSVMAVLGRKGSKKEAKITDFMPQWEGSHQKKQSVEEMKNVLMAIAYSHNRKNKK